MIKQPDFDNGDGIADADNITALHHLTTLFTQEERTYWNEEFWNLDQSKAPW